MSGVSPTVVLEGSCLNVLMQGDQIDIIHPEHPISREPSHDQTVLVAQRTLSSSSVTNGNTPISLASEHTMQPVVDTTVSREFEACFHPDGVSVTRHFSGIVEGRTVHVYHMKALDGIVKAVWRFVQNRSRDLVSTCDEAHVKEIVTKKPYIVIQEWTQHVENSSINRVALCLASSPRFGPIPRGVRKDRYFSCDDIKNPSRCPQGHVFEYEHLLAWQRHHGTNICPVGDEHPLIPPGGDGCIHVDESIKREMVENEKRIMYVQKICKKVLSIVYHRNISIRKRLVEGAAGTLGLGASGAAIGVLVAGVPGAIAGGAVGCAIGAVSGAFCFLSFLWDRVMEFITNKACWENEVKRQFTKFLMHNFRGGEATKDSVNSNFRAVEDPFLRFDKISEKILLTFHQLLNAAREEALTKV